MIPPASPAPAPTPAALPAPRRARWITLARAGFLALAGLAALALIARDHAAILAALARTDPALIALALIASLANIAMTAVSWRLTLAAVPGRPSWLQSARVFFLGQLGKYVPGSVWSFLATGELAHQAGLARATAVSSLMLAVLIGLGSGAVLGLAIVPDALSVMAFELWAAPLLALPAVLLTWPRVRKAVLARARIDFPIAPCALIASGAVALAAWLFAGVQIALIVDALGAAPPPGFIVLAAGYYALAWTAGFVFFVAPAGLGAREGVLVALLSSHMPLADALVTALLARVLVTAADLTLALAALIIRPAQAAPAAA